MKPSATATGFVNRMRRLDKMTIPSTGKVNHSIDIEGSDSTASDVSEKTRKGKHQREAPDSPPVPCNSQITETGIIEDVMKLILSRLDCRELFQAKVQSKTFQNIIESDDFYRLRGELRPQEAELTALHFSVRKDNMWQCHGHDLITNTWSKLPPFQMLPLLNTDLFKEHSICGAAGLMCVNVGTVSDRLILFNPLTGFSRELGPLNHARLPVLMHMIFNYVDNSYKIIVAGSSRLGDDKVSRITEVLDSRTSKWKVTADVPGPVFALNDYQTGVYAGGFLYCIAFLPAEGKGIIAYDVQKEKWAADRTYALPYSLTSNTVQLVENSGRVYLFSELEHLDPAPDPLQEYDVEHRIDELLVNEEHMCSERRWRQVMVTRKRGSMGLQAYPEHTCAPFGKGKLCIFNRIKHCGVVYDGDTGERCESLLPSPSQSGCAALPFYSLNPLTFDFKPSFKCSI